MELKGCEEKESDEEAVVVGGGGGFDSLWRLCVHHIPTQFRIGLPIAPPSPTCFGIRYNLFVVFSIYSRTTNNFLAISF